MSVATSPDARPVLTSQLQESDTVAIGDLWRIMRHRWRWIVGTAVVFVVTALLYGMLTSSQFTATAQIIIDPRDKLIVDNDVNPGGISPDGGITQVESQVSVLQSTAVLLRAIAATDLTSDPEFNSTDHFLSRLFGSSDTPSAGISTDRTLSSADVRTLIALRRALAVKRPDKLLVIDVSVTTRNADKSARLANAIAEAYLADQASARAQGAQEASDALTARLAGLRKQVQNAENAVESYKVTHNIVAANGELVSEQQLSNATRELSDAQNLAASLKARVDQIDQQRRKATTADSIAEAIQSPVIVNLRQQESALVQSEVALSAKLGPRHPQVTAVQQQLVKMRQLIASELDRIAVSASADNQRAVANEKALSAKLESLKSRSLSNDQASVQLRELERDLDAVRTVYSSYLVRALETHEQVNLDSSNARIITQAIPPQKRSWPPLSILVAGALIGGLGLGAGIALIREYASPTLLSVAQAESVTGVPVIGILPAKAKVNDRLLWRRLAPKLVNDSRSEAVASVVLEWLFESEYPARPALVEGSILVTSGPKDDAERQRSALLLLTVAAVRGELVLFMDANVINRLQTSNVGLEQLLRGERVLQTVTRRDAGRCVALVDTGDRSPSSAKERKIDVSKVLNEALRLFDLVVVDGGAVAESPQIAPVVAAVDHVLIIGRLAGTSQNDMVKTIQALSVMRRSASGVLLVDPVLRVA
jgi:uncharacterized protein involved in exopolysaccharide biosynthesis/Mrp family chromosome partitioning ATPase